MPLPMSLVGSTTAPSSLAVDVRATMAFAAGIDDPNPAYLTTGRSGGVVAHPLFPVRPEWPAVLAAGRLAPELLTRAEARVGLHVGHDLEVHRLVRPGDRLRTTATVESIARHRAGALEVLRLETIDQDGVPVATTSFTMLFRDVEILADAGVPDTVEAGPVLPPIEPVITAHRLIAATAAHVYTECARIWNPIHTDPLAARRAGLDDIVLHGTATLAMAVTEVIARHAGGDPTQVRRIRCRFGAMVTVPSTVTIRVGDRAGDHVGFEVTNEDGERAIRDGSLTLAPRS